MPEEQKAQEQIQIKVPTAEEAKALESKLNAMHRMNLFEQIENSFAYHRPTEEQAQFYPTLREQAKGLALYAASNISVSAELTVAIRKLEEFVMWANKAVAMHGLYQEEKKEEQTNA